MATEEKLPPARVAKRVSAWVIRRAANQLITQAPHLDNPIYRPLINSYIRTCMLLERCYVVLGTDAALLDEDGELRPSIDTCRRLAESAAKLAKALCISPETFKAMTKERQAKSLEQLRREADEAEAEAAETTEEEAF